MYIYARVNATLCFIIVISCSRFEVHTVGLDGGFGRFTHTHTHYRMHIHYIPSEVDAVTVAACVRVHCITERHNAQREYEAEK